MGAELALGLMSGTSADGVSLAVVEVRGRRLRVLADRTYPYPPGLRRRVLAAPRAAAAELSALDFDLGRAFARAALAFLRASGVPARRLAAVGSHGQTVVHRPDAASPSTLQIGEASFLAEALNVPTACDFRPRDVAAGGQGAPLAPFFDELLFGDGPPRILQNVGGVANAALVGRGTAPVAFDTGPGNAVMDAAARRASGGRLHFDRDGRLARRGRADEALVRRLLRLPYFSRRPPKSLDRAAFAEDFLSRWLPVRRFSHEDALATATAFTAASITDQAKRFLLPRARVSEMLVSGGGALNGTLMARLGELMPVPVLSSAARGLAPMAKEPALMAVLGLYAVRGRANNAPRATGARGPRVLGKVIAAL
ncbi:MAG: anhydro-N-acetylmuramic acid kinase [Elusimicrobia bacterium]|nr:anhydro-N-acetylmuramic acid kinase [Elusimicrobiota bacterium]